MTTLSVWYISVKWSVVAVAIWRHGKQAGSTQSVRRGGGSRSCYLHYCCTRNTSHHHLQLPVSGEWGGGWGRTATTAASHEAHYGAHLGHLGELLILCWGEPGQAGMVLRLFPKWFIPRKTFLLLHGKQRSLCGVKFNLSTFSCSVVADTVLHSLSLL
jgi:hypothetical protein